MTYVVSLEAHRLVGVCGALKVFNGEGYDGYARFHRPRPFRVTLADEGTDAFLGIARQHVFRHHLRCVFIACDEPISACL